MELIVISLIFASTVALVLGVGALVVQPAANPTAAPSSSAVTSRSAGTPARPFTRSANSSGGTSRYIGDSGAAAAFHSAAEAAGSMESGLTAWSFTAPSQFIAR